MTRQNQIERLAKFMGWRPRVHPETSVGTFYTNEKGELFRSVGEKKHFESYIRFDPRTNLNDAFMVAEKIAKGLFVFELHKMEDDWDVAFRDIESPEPPLWFQSQVHSEAIFNAAIAYLDATEGK